MPKPGLSLHSRLYFAHNNYTSISREQLKSGLKTWLFVQASTHGRRLTELSVSGALQNC